MAHFLGVFFVLLAGVSFGEKLGEGIFEEGISVEIRRERVAQALELIPNRWNRGAGAEDRLQAAKISKKLEESFPKDWWALEAAAHFLEEAPIYGVLSEDGFDRSLSWSTSTHQVNDRDRVKRIQLLWEAAKLGKGVASGDELASIFQELAAIFQTWEGESELTNLEALPDYEPVSWGNHRRRSSDKDKPFVIPERPVTFDSAKTDHERVLWCLHRGEELMESSAKRAELKYAKADFWSFRLSVARVAGAGFVYVEGLESGYDVNAPGEFELHTLKDSETLVVDQGQPKRITLDEEYQFIPALLEIVKNSDAPEELRLRATLDLIEEHFPDRRQYERAAQLAEWVKDKYGVDEKGPWDFSENVTNPEFEIAGESSFMEGKVPEVVIYSRVIEKLELEIWKLKEGNLDELLSDGHYFSDLVWGQVWGLLIKGKKDPEYNEASFEKLFEYKKDWVVPLKMKPLHLQSAITAEVPVTEVGSYVLVGKEGNVRRLYPFQIYNTVLLRSGISGADVYAMDPKTGEPLEGVEVHVAPFFEDSQYLVTDHAGRLQLDKDFYAHDLARGFLMRRPESSWHTGRLEGGHSRQDNCRYTPFVLTSQPLYRPGQKVSLSAWIRNAPGWTPYQDESLEGMKVKIIVTDPTGREVFSSESKLDAFGGLTADFQLKDEVVLGRYEIILKSLVRSEADPFAEVWVWSTFQDDSYRHTSWFFEVGEVRKPDYQVTLTPVAGDSDFEMMLEASYLSGEPVRGASVEARLEGSPDFLRFYPQQAWGSDDVSGDQWALPIPKQCPDWRSWAIWPEYMSLYDEYDGQDYGVANDFNIITDDEGKARLSFDLEFPFLEKFPYHVNVRADVTEVTGRQVRAQKDWIHTGRPYEPYAQPLRGFYGEGETVTLGVGLIDTNGAPKFGVGVLKVELMHNEGLQELLKREVKVDESGLVEIDFPAPAAGQYRCVFCVGECERGFVLEILGKERAEAERQYEELQIIAREPIIKEAGVLEILVCTPAQSGGVWLFESVSEETERSPRFIVTEDHHAVVKLQVHHSFMPNFFVNGLTYHEGVEKYAECRVAFPDLGSRLRVELDTTPEKGRPGEGANVAVDVRKYDGNPAKAAVALTVFDRGLEDVSSPLPSVSRLRDDFRFSNGVYTSTDRERGYDSAFPGLSEIGAFSERGSLAGKVERRKNSYFLMEGRDVWCGYHPPELPNQVGGPQFQGSVMLPNVGAYKFADQRDLSDEEAGLMGAIKARERFVDSAYWGGALRTGADGRVEVDFELPDNLTSWQVQAWAFEKGWAFGEAEMELLVSKDLQVRPLRPRSTVEGDQLVLGAIVQNLSKEADEFVVMLEVEGLSLQDDEARVVMLQPGEEGIVQWKVEVMDAGVALMEVKALGKQTKLEDGFVERLLVRAREVTYTVSGAAYLKTGEDAVVLKIQSDPAMAGQMMTVRAEANAAVSSLLVLPDLARYPYGCVEQTTNRFLPLMIASQSVEKLGLKWSEMSAVFKKRDYSMGWLNEREAVRVREIDLGEEKVADMINIGVDRLGKLQRSDGWWGWFSPDDAEPRVEMTVMALRGLLLANAREQNETSDNVISRAVMCLKRWSQRLEIVAETPQEKLAEAAYVAWSLQMAESDAAQDLVKNLNQVCANLPTTSKIHLALAMSSSPEQAELIKMIRSDRNSETEKERLTWWNDELEQRAYFLKLLVKIGAEKGEIETEINELLDARQDGVRWRNTRASALCVEVIIEAMLALEKDFSNVESEHRLVISGLGEDREVVLSRANLWTDLVEIPMPAELPNEILIQAKNHGEEVVKAVASISYLSGDEEVMSARNDGLKVYRKYYRKGVDGRETLLADGETIQVGELIKVVLDISADGAREYLHLRDPIPAGFEQLTQLSGYDNGAFRQSRTGEMHFFISELSQWNRRHSYILSAVAEGTSLALPTQVECMYAPDLRGQSAARKVVVERAE